MNVLFNNEVYDLSFRGLRYSLHQTIEEHFDKVISEPEDHHFEELEELQAMVSNQDIEGLINNDLLNCEFYFEIFDENLFLENALKNVGYQLEKSNVSRSIYAINDHNKEVRIADHKRPAYSHNGSYYNHEYDLEFIVNDNTIDSETLKLLGFSRVKKGEFVLG